MMTMGKTDEINHFILHFWRELIYNNPKVTKFTRIELKFVQRLNLKSIVLNTYITKHLYSKPCCMYL